MSVTPLQNRVTPAGEIVADPARGTLMGNRGCLHRADRTLGVARWRSKLWICCVLRWRDVRRDVMPPGRWTALFFLDEATALAAGHRPCGYCRRAAYASFTDAWRRAAGLARPPRAGEMDATLHAERVDPRTRRQRTRPALAGELPDGVMVRHDGTCGLLAGEASCRGRFAATWPRSRCGRPRRVELLTPPSTVAAIAAGYGRLLHPSAMADPS